MKIFLRVIAVFYVVGALLHLADLFDLRLKFSEMDRGWKIWILYLLILDCMAAVGLWKDKSWGLVAFLIVSASQLIAYILFQDFFGPQWPLVIFHIAVLCGFFSLGGFRRMLNLGVMR